MKQYYADKTCLNLLRVLIFILTAGLIIADFYFLYFIPILMWILAGVFGAAYIVIGVIWLPIYFSKASYGVSSKEIIRRTGFLWRMQQVMRVSSVQYVTLITTPFSKYTGLNFVLINALGGTVILQFLSRKDADEIFKTLTFAINQNNTTQKH